MSSCVENEAAYEAAIVRNIRANARKTFLKRDRAAEVVNWIADGRSEWDAETLREKPSDVEKNLRLFEDSNARLPAG
jgi:hypothetical protein